MADEEQGGVGRDPTGQRRGVGMGTPPGGNDVLTVHLRVHHLHRNAHQTEASAVFDRVLRTVKKPAAVEVEVTAEARPLETVLGEYAGYLLIKNLLPTYAVNPTAEVRAADSAKDVRVMIGADQPTGWTVKPGGCFLAEPERDEVYLQSVTGEPVTIEVVAFPQ